MREKRVDMHIDPGGGPGTQRVDVCVQLGTFRYVLEHTRIDPFENALGIGCKVLEFGTPINKALFGALPGPAFYDLVLPQDLKLGGKSRKQISAIQEALIDWVSDEGPRLYHQAKTSGLLQPRASAVKEFPDLLPYRASLTCCLSGPPSETEAGMFGISRIPDDDLEELRFQRLLRALSDKCPKLQCCKDRRATAKTILVLECDDIAISNSDVIRTALERAAGKRTDIPDEVYLVQTMVDTWYVHPMNSAAETDFPTDYYTKCKAFESAVLEDLTVMKTPGIQCDVCVGC